MCQGHMACRAPLEGELDRGVIAERICSCPVLNTLSRRKHQVIMLAQIVDNAEIESGLVLAVRCVRGLVKEVAAYGEVVGDLALHRPPEIPEVAIADARIDPVTGARECRPRAKTLLQPYREKDA